jgi:hypothetical protein
MIWKPFDDVSRWRLERAPYLAACDVHFGLTQNAPKAFGEGCEEKS